MTHLKRGDTTFKILDEEQQKKDLEEQQKKDLEKQKKIKTRKYRGSLNGADALRNLVRIEGSNHDLTISDPLKLTDSSLSHSMRDYRQGSREKSSRKRESRSRSKSNSSLPPSEELNTDSSSVVVKETPSSKNEPMEETKNKNSSFPALGALKSKRNNMGVIGHIISHRGRNKVALPAIYRGGRKKTSKRRRAKKSYGWFP